jgi:putative glutamine amidotransferase
MEVSLAQPPLIGITPSISVDTLAHGTFERYVLNAAYANAIIASGGIPVALPYMETGVEAVLDRLDGLVLSGGGDVEPARFGASSIHPETYGILPARDQFEHDLIHHALRRDMPVLGICRGIQVLNVALGGTLVQDIADQHESSTPVSHRQQADGIAANQPGHTVTIAAGSLLHVLVGQTSLPVNSFHHQAIDRLATGLEAIAVAHDGLIEAVVLPDHRFVLGVQWHPELMFAEHPVQLLWFEALVSAAKVHQSEAVTVSI